MCNSIGQETENEIKRVIILRLAVGILGERDQSGWWSSSYFGSTSQAFLAPVFGKHAFQAKYQGVVEAARRVHDERIGIGNVFHPFRLPEIVEQQIHDTFLSFEDAAAEQMATVEAAKAALLKINGTVKDLKEGPTLLQSPEAAFEIDWLKEAASLYSTAFDTGIQCFPYIRYSG
jgi:hypothetical protein